MPRKKWIDKSTATTFALVHRPQDDPRIHDELSSSMVFKELAPTQSHKIRSRSDLEFVLGQEIATGRVRDNEGEAAEHGIYYDDTDYDYMQHLRDLGGGGSTEVYFVEAKLKDTQRGNGKANLEDALRNASLEDDKSETASIIGSHSSGSCQSRVLYEDLLRPKNKDGLSYQNQQDVPDALAGFQPDMDPRLREVLEALDDDAYVDDEENIFIELTRDGEVTTHEFEELGFVGKGTSDEDGGWESDDTEKPRKDYQDTVLPHLTVDEDIKMDHYAELGDDDWMKEYERFQKVEKAKKPQAISAASDLRSSVISGTSMTHGRRKKRRGAMTSSTGQSMTSSSLFRTEGLTLLDDRFDKIEEDYAEDEMEINDEVSVATGTMSVASSQVSQVPALRSDFDSIMNEFLGGYSMSGKKRVKKGRFQSGMEQLDEVRKGLGPAKIRMQKIQ